MSLILEALKKSEDKRRKKNGQISQTIHEPLANKISRPRSWGLWLLGILFVFLVNVVFVVWFFSPWVKSLPTTREVLVVDSNQPMDNSREPVSSPPTPSVPRSIPESHIVATQQQPEESKEQPRAKAVPTPRSEIQIYSFSQLPASIQKQIPTLRMSLHAYNRDDATASMVQLNDRIMHEKEMVTANISLEQITAEGVVLRYDGYRFLLPRRGK